MENKEISEHKITLYSDIEEMPSWRYSKFNKYMILNDEVGSDFVAVDKHFTRLYQLVNSPTKLKAQLDIFRQLIYSADKEQSFITMAYACLVHSIDGEQRNDLTVQGIKETVQILNFVKSGEVKKKQSNFLMKLRKNLKRLTVIFSRIRYKSGITKS